MTRPRTDSQAQRETLLVTLTTKVRLLSVEQAARAFWEDTERGREAARRTLNALESAGFIEKRAVLIHPELALAEPVLVWRPGERTPHFGHYSYLCRSRWTEPLVSKMTWIATKKAANLLGGFSGKRYRLNHATHDLHVTSLYLALFQNDPGQAAAWTPEEMQKGVSGERLPDAVFVDERGEVYRAIDFGGSCTASRIQKLHDYGTRYSVPYELW